MKGGDNKMKYKDIHLHELVWTDERIKECKNTFAEVIKKDVDLEQPFTFVLNMAKNDVSGYSFHVVYEVNVFYFKDGVVKCLEFLPAPIYLAIKNHLLSVPVFSKEETVFYCTRDGLLYIRIDSNATLECPVFCNSLKEAVRFIQKIIIMALYPGHNYSNFFDRVFVNVVWINK